MRGSLWEKEEKKNIARCAIERELRLGRGTERERENSAVFFFPKQ